MATTPIPDLRPLSLGELLDRTFSLYRSHFWLFVGIMAIPSAFSIPFTTVFFFTQGRATFTGLGGRPAPQFPAGPIAVAGAFLVLSWMTYAMSLGAVTFAVSETYLGHKATVRQAYGRVRGKLMKIIGLCVVAILRGLGMFLVVGAGAGILFAVGVGLTTTVVARGLRPTPAVGIVIGILLILGYLAGMALWLWWFLRYAVCIPALLLEDLRVLPALRRSVQLTHGRRWQMFAAIALCTIIAYTGVIIFQGPFLFTMMFTDRGGRIPDWLAFVLATSGAVGGAITGPLLLIIVVLYYYDARIRKEGFDLQFMMSSLEISGSAPGTVLPG